MFTKNFYRRLWRHWITPNPASHTFPSAMYGVPANGNPFIVSQTNTIGSSSGGINWDNFGSGTYGPITYTYPSTSGAAAETASYGQYIPGIEFYVTSSADLAYSLKRLTLTETAYNENTFYDQTVANTAITDLSFTVRSAQSDNDIVYDSTTDSIKKTYSYTVTNNGANTITVRALTGTKNVLTRATEGGSTSPSYLLIWAINLDTPVELLPGESATLTITYRWNNCTPGSQASPYSISASIE